MRERAENPNVSHRKPVPKPSFSRKRLRHNREENDETDKEKGNEREQRILMHPIESLLRSRHSVGSKSETEKEQAEGNDKETEKDEAV